jgi:hypothetical protein
MTQTTKPQTPNPDARPRDASIRYCLECKGLKAILPAARPGGPLRDFHIRSCSSWRLEQEQEKPPTIAHDPRCNGQHEADDHCNNVKPPAVVDDRSET